MKNNIRAKGIKVWLIAVSFYCFTVSLRGIFSAANENIMADFDITYTKIGYLRSGFTMVYGLFSFVSGFLIESYGARRILLIGSMIISLSGFMIFKSQIFFMMAFSSILLGAPVSTGWPTVGYCVNKYFSKKYDVNDVFLLHDYLVGSGIGNFLSRFLISISNDWRDIPYMIFILGLLFFIIIKFFFYNKAKKENKPEDTNDSYSLKIIIKNLRLLLHKKTLWSICFVGAALYSPMVIWGDNYGQSYIKNVLCANAHQASIIPPLIYTGFCFGNFVSTYISINITKSEFVTLFINNVTSLVMSILLILNTVSNIYVFGLFMFIMGVAKGADFDIFYYWILYRL